MASRRILFIAIPVVVVAAVLVFATAAGLWFGRPKPVAVTIEVTGTTGLPIKGTSEVDGTSQDLTGVVPTRFVLEGRKVTFSLTTPEDKGGEFRVKTTAGETLLAPSGSGNPPKNGVRGWVQTNWGWSSPAHWIEPFPKDGQQGWLKPPP
jgi:hypothetical protein